MKKTTIINYQPGGRDVVFEIEQETSSIILTEEVMQQKIAEGENTLELVAVGPDVVGYEVGDKVLLRSTRWMSIAVDNKEYAQMSQSELLGKVLNNASTKMTKQMKDRMFDTSNLGVIGSSHSKHVK